MSKASKKTKKPAASIEDLRKDLRWFEDTLRTIKSARSGCIPYQANRDTTIVGDFTLDQPIDTLVFSNEESHRGAGGWAATHAKAMNKVVEARGKLVKAMEGEE